MSLSCSSFPCVCSRVSGALALAGWLALSVFRAAGAEAGDTVAPAVPDPVTTNAPAATNAVRPVLDTSRPMVATVQDKAATASSVTGTNRIPQTNFAHFHILTERNIFNPNRSAKSSRGEGETKKPVKVEAFQLVGVMSYAKGDFAFFEGSGSEFRKVLQKDGRIAGYQVTELGSGQVKLVAADQKATLLRVGGQMRRKDEGPWELAEEGAAMPASSTGTAVSGSGDAAAPAASSSGGADSILERLRRKREQEMNNEKP